MTQTMNDVGGAAEGAAGMDRPDAACMDLRAIRRILPHRAPFLFVDAVIALEPGVRCVGLKSVTGNEWFFPTEAGDDDPPPSMPGLLILEALAQVGGVLLLHDVPDVASKVVYFASAANVAWHGAVGPGDQLRLEVEATHSRGRLHKVQARAWVRDALVCEGELAAVVADR